MSQGGGEEKEKGHILNIKYWVKFGCMWHIDILITIFKKKAKKHTIDLERPFNELIEEALRDLLKKYKNKSN